jgi:hypothetical protein
MYSIAKLSGVLLIAAFSSCGVAFAQSGSSDDETDRAVTSCGRGTVYDSNSGTCAVIKGGRAGFNLEGTSETPNVASTPTAPKPATKPQKTASRHAKGKSVAQNTHKSTAVTKTASVSTSPKTATPTASAALGAPKAQ